MEQQNSFSGWAKVEVMGHQSHIGLVTTQVFGTACMFRVDQPEIPADEKVTTREDWLDGRRIPVGTTVKRGAIPAATVLVGSASIYRITPCTEEAALKAIEQSVTRPLIPVGLPDLPALPEPLPEPHGTTELLFRMGQSRPEPEDESQDDSDLCMDCGKPEDFCTCDGQ